MRREIHILKGATVYCLPKLISGLRITESASRATCGVCLRAKIRELEAKEANSLKAFRRRADG